MADTGITKDDINFDDEPEFEVSDAAAELCDDIDGYAILAAIGFSSLLWEIMTDDQKTQLTDWERAALEKLHEFGDEVGLEGVGSKLRD